MKKILCPTDFSDEAANAMAYAGKLAYASGAELILYNVRSLWERVAQEVIFGAPLTYKKISEELEEQSREIAEIFKISCYAEVEPSSTSLAGSIEKKARDYDLIVMGTNGFDDLYQFFTGSNTYRVIQKTKIPVLVVPVNAGYSEIKRMVYSFNYLKERSLPMDQLIPWLEILKSELTVLQVMEEAHSKVVDDELKELQEIIALSKSNVKFSFDTIRSSDIAQSINTYIQRNEIDVLALCTLHRNFIENFFHKSVIRNISAVGSYPIFIFHH
ncbi:MAG TPA: universal stress protein [Cyclobacteriaceae bacterium]|nr:universal stress protein [Cyclobacteriaceae bacterium]